MVETKYGTGRFRILVYHPTVLIRDSHIDVEVPLEAPANMSDGVSDFLQVLGDKFMEQELEKLID